MGTTHHFWESHEELLVRLLKEEEKKLLMCFEKQIRAAQLHHRRHIPD